VKITVKEGWTKNSKLSILAIGVGILMIVFVVAID
jgi:hypothetical protein